jgi:hypothetical protein
MSKTTKNLAVTIWALAITCFVGCGLFRLAYIARGYMAFGGETLLVPIIYWGAWRAVKALTDSLEG